jgi:putative transposase
MPRKPRVEYVGAIIHATARRVDRWPMFVDDQDYERYIALLAETVERFGWILLSFCLMPNHIHLLVELREPNFGKGMQSLHTRYVRWFNDRHARHGRLFEHRYNPKLVEDELYFLTVVKYIELNPVDAALCKRPEDWHWSSRGVIKTRGCPAWLSDDVLTLYRDGFRT